MAEFVLTALRQLWDALSGRNVPMALMGGLAVAAWKHPRATRDIDLLIAIDPPATDDLIRDLRDAGLYPKHDPFVSQVDETRFIQFSYRPTESHFALRVDFLLADSEYHRMALNRRRTIRIDEIDRDVAVLSCEDLILHKLLAGRMIDRADASSLLAINRAVLEFDYLHEWTRRLAVESEYEEVWQATFPGEQIPGA